ncbi:CYSTEINE PROTEINASE INHIBITOR 5 [Salix purpurea]|uniref:CYSTEINE PROTEINASE INHIBITOR 5 n=1 Tax=Salix purpurea TaxID=77065 RepID=A0A9Q0Q5J5_SALPP|nr:CYSTEINE PROTEINASE INHIBITOR 5 [Salix purpurea]
MKLQVLALSLLFIAATVVVIDAALVGGWSPIEDLKDKHVVEIAEFAVAEHNKEVKSNLKLESIVKGESQVVSGTNYRLVLAVTGGAYAKYQAVVYEKPWEQLKSLTSFVPFKG